MIDRITLKQAVILFGGDPTPPVNHFTLAPVGWAGFLEKVAGKLAYFAPTEFIRPVKVQEWSIPPHEYWLHLALMAMAADQYRAAAGCPVRVRYAYRDEALNRAVNGAHASDHLTASGIDLEALGELAHIGTVQARRRLCDVLYRLEGLQVSIGEGRTITHLGVLSVKGQRRWAY